VTPDPPFTVHVAQEAAERIRRRGGRLYLWNEPVGRIGVRDRLAFHPPSDRAFECYLHAKRDVQICVPPDFAFSEMIVRAQRRPFGGVRVYADGKRWGRRGGDAGSAPAG
jgi:hypothetical protein